ncbi:MAG: GNAT family N-acetyltransferase [Saprospiraceae bacterium]|nr:GNAT family N-acetyltransferase [Saprospiraceae bacterium]
MNLQPILEDELIILKPLTESHFEPLYEIAKDPLIWEQHPCHKRHRKEVYSDFFKDSLKSRGALIIIDKSNDKIIGSTRFKPVKNVRNAVEIGWSFLGRDYWGGRFNKSMKRLMIEYAFEAVEDIIFHIGRDNVRSQKAVEKIGGIRISDLAHQHLTNANPNDWTYRITKRDWQS